MHNRFLALVTLGALACPIGAQAVPLYEHQFPVDLTPAFCTPCGDTYRMWDTFTLSTTADVTSIEARLQAPAGSYSGQVEYSVWTADRNALLFSQAFDWSALGPTAVADARFDTTAALAGLSLEAGSYALSIFGLNESVLAWLQSDVTVHGRSFQSHGGAGSGVDMAFRINGLRLTQVSEPGSLFLTALGVFGLAFTRRRRLS